jgi:hypothetical protein
MAVYSLCLPCSRNPNYLATISRQALRSISQKMPCSALKVNMQKKHKKLPAQIYLSAGELEEETDDTTLTNMYRFAALLESRKYKGFSLTKQVFLDNNHCEVNAPAFQAGLKLALKK